MKWDFCKPPSVAIFQIVSQRLFDRANIQRLVLAAIAGLAALLATAEASRADEGGVSFWIPGFFGSLAATPTAPGWSVTSIYYHDSVSAGGNVTLAREFQIRNGPANLTASFTGNVNASVNVDLMVPTYTFATPVLGAQVSVPS